MANSLNGKKPDDMVNALVVDNIQLRPKGCG
jgi:hypothetical protein